MKERVREVNLRVALRGISLLMMSLAEERGALHPTCASHIHVVFYRIIKLITFILFMIT